MGIAIDYDIMAKFRLIKLVESRIRGDLYVRFGGEYLETCRRNTVRRRMLSLHNQCVLSAQRSACNFGKDKVSTEGLFEKVNEWLGQFDSQMKEDRERISRLKETVLSAQDIFAIIGLLTTFRVAHDSKDKRLSNLVKSYPLNQAQISVFTENLIKKQLEKSQLTAWDVYNVATEILKPNRAEIPTILNQNAAFADFLFQYYATDNVNGVLQNGIISLPL